MEVGRQKLHTARIGDKVAVGPSESVKAGNRTVDPVPDRRTQRIGPLDIRQRPVLGNRRALEVDT